MGGTVEAFHTNIIATRFTRRYTHEGEARMTRKIDETIGEAVAAEIAEGKRVFLEAERARVLCLLADGREVPDFTEPSICAETGDSIRGDRGITREYN